MLKFPQIVLFRLSTESSLRWKSFCLRTGKSIIFLSSQLYSAQCCVVVINGCREERRRINVKMMRTQQTRRDEGGKRLKKEKRNFLSHFLFLLCFSSHLRSPQYGEKQQESGIYAQTRQRVENCCSRMKRTQKRRHMKEQNPSADEWSWTKRKQHCVR